MILGSIVIRKQETCQGKTSFLDQRTIWLVCSSYCPSYLVMRRHSDGVHFSPLSGHHYVPTLYVPGQWVIWTPNTLYKYTSIVLLCLQIKFVYPSSPLSSSYKLNLHLAARVIYSHLELGGEREEKVQGGVISISSPTEGNECLICGLWNAKWFTGDQQAVDGWLVLPLRQVSAMWLTFVNIIVHNRIRQCNNAALLLSFGSYRHGNKFVFPCYCRKFIGVYISQLMRTGRLDRETGC